MNISKITFPTFLPGAAILLACLAGCTPEGEAHNRPLPPPTEWMAPAELLAWTGQKSTNNEAPPPVTVPDPAAPEVAAWHETVNGDESFVLTGVRFTSREGELSGSDTIVWVQAVDGGPVQQAKIWSVDPEVLIATMPEDAGTGLILVWVENEKGAGAPVAINRTRPQWIGPLGNQVQPGDTKRIIGRNLNAGKQKPRVVIRSGSNFQDAGIKEVTPYSIEFVVPDLEDGDYEVWVHNGSGDELGWGGPLELRVEPSWQRGSKEIALTPTGGDDWQAIQDAVTLLGEEPNGGTLKLAAADFRISRMVNLPPMVRIAGEGMDKTRLIMDFELPQHSGITFQDGPHIALEDLTLEVINDRGHPPQYGIFNTVWKGRNDWLRLARIRFLAENGVASNINVGGSFIEVTGVESWNRLGHSGSGHWLHNNTYYGQIYGRGAAGVIASSLEESIIEKNHLETPDWPEAADGNRNYTEFIDPEKLMNEFYFCKRVLSSGLRTDRNFLTLNTSKDVAANGNLAEMVLFHGLDGTWFGAVAKSEDLNLQVEASGQINGEPVTLARGKRSSTPFDPEKVTPGEDSIVITAGPGLGQARLITAVNGNVLTIDRPWRVAPDASSRIMIAPLIEENIVYKNELEAFPEGYRLRSFTASSPVSFWGNCWNNVSEENHSRGTNSASTVWSLDASPSYWNVFRSDVAKGVFGNGFTIVGEGQDLPAGGSTLGNALRHCVIEIVGNQPGTGSSMPMISNQASPLAANIFEHTSMEGKTQLAIDPGAHSLGLFRKLRIALEPFGEIVEDNFARPVKRHPATLLQTRENTRPILAELEISGVEAPMEGETSVTGNLLPLHRVLFVNGEGEAVLPVANTGLGAIEPVVGGLPEGVEAALGPVASLASGEVADLHFTFTRQPGAQGPFFLQLSPGDSRQQVEVRFQ